MFAIQKKVNFSKNIKRIKILENIDCMPSRVIIELSTKNTRLEPMEIKGILDELKKAKIKNIHLTGVENQPNMKRILNLSKSFSKTMDLNLGGRKTGTIPLVEKLILNHTKAQQIDTELYRKIKAKDILLAISIELNNSIINSLENVYERLSKASFDEILFKRPARPIAKKRMIEAICKIIKLNEEHHLSAFIQSPIPFCIYDADKVKKVCIGGFCESGYSDLAIDARGRIKPELSSNVVLGIVKSKPIKSCWNSEYMKNIRQFRSVARMCMYCNYLFVCGGGKIDRNSKLGYFPTDPLIKN